MGLDGVELIIAIEDEFKVTLTPQEVFEADTVGRVVDVIYTRLRHSNDDPCLSQQGFHVVRKRLMEQFSISRSEIKPDSKLETLIPAVERRAEWNELIAALAGEKCDWIGLERPDRINRFVVFVFPLIAFVATALFVPMYLIWLGIVPAILALIVGNRMTEKYAVLIPQDYSEVKSLIPLVKSLDNRVWTKDEVFAKVRDITVDVLAVTPDKVKLESRWVNDLGMD